MSKLVANRYEIVKSLGHGGMANVYLALDRVLNREVAIKILKADMSSDPVSLERFSREANASTKLTHPNVVDIYDVGEYDGEHYIVMEYVKGYTLKQLIQRRGAIPPREAVWMIKQLAGALMEAHKNGLIHRDIKSQNVLIKDDGTIKLADFGIAVLNNALQLTSKDSVLGSVHYLAPELARGGSASMQSDIYSLGIVLYELLTGDVPFKGDTPVQVALKHIKSPLPDVKKFNPSIPQSVVNVLTKATAKDTKNRYENVALMLKDLNTCLDESRIHEQPIRFVDSDPKDEKKFNEFNISASANNVKKQKSKKGFSVLLITSISLISILAIVVILLLAGVFSGNNSKNLKVPEIVGLRYVSAIDALDAAGIECDYPINYVLTDDAEEGQVIDVYPKQGSSIEKGTKVKLTVSNGKFKVMSDYVNKNISEATAELANTNIYISTNSITDDLKEPGTITAQDGLKPGDKYDPSVSSNVIFTVAYPSEIHIPIDILGRELSDARDYLEEMDINVETEEIDTDELSEADLIRFKAGDVCKVEPEEGSLYIKSDDSKVILYYYE